ncbi:TolC family protein [Christiangramia fulva]|uniref:TolC family protein n=1 Tax=Christiangramia fulva TaxID=2126553 RepID=A0A2R3Z160_9FLAO|nr:TolC family protein [Christiangramia fulva]AVR44001.1 TolC family protein [Christiangramia fulva]
MRFKFILSLILLSTVSIFAQERDLSLQEAVELALTHSQEIKIAESQVNTAASQLKVTKDNIYPDFDISGQYAYLTNADVNLKINTGNGNSDNSSDQPGESPKVNQLMLGQANLNLPLFAGFKLKNSVDLSQNSLEAAKSNFRNDQEKVTLQTIQNYLNLYKATRAVDLLQESLKSAQRRVKDFTAMENNGILARNDLLKSQLQEDNTRLSLKEAEKNVEILNFQLVTLLGLPEETKITVENIGVVNPVSVLSPDASRSDLEALQYQEKAAESAVKVAKGNYFPSIGLSAGYIALDLQNALTVSNAMNFGVGIKYNFASLFKNKHEVDVAKSKAEELQHRIESVSDQIKIQIKKAEKDYQLALEKFDVYKKSETQAVENYRIVKDKYDNGLMDTNDLLEADVEQLQTKINLAYAKADITQKYYELLRAQGNLTNSFTK